MTDVLLQARDARVLTLTLNRPDKRNALTPEMLACLHAALEQAACDPGIGAVVLTGTPPAFCAGGDVGVMAAGGRPAPADPQERIRAMRARVDIARLLHEMGKPTVAMVRGAAAGAGLSLALACDFRVLSASARLITAFVRVALPGDYGGHYFLARLVGAARARELYMLSPAIGADEALAMGLANRVAGEDTVVADTMALAHRLADGPTQALAAIKRNANLALGASLPAVLDAEVEAHVACLASAEHREAARAAVEKRPPRYR